MATLEDPVFVALMLRLGYESGRSKQAPFPFTSNLSVDFIANIGNKLWNDLVGHSVSLNVTNVSLAFAGIDIAESGQQSIEGAHYIGVHRYVIDILHQYKHY